jgi:hypothetical protein
MLARLAAKYNKVKELLLLWDCCGIAAISRRQQESERNDHRAPAETRQKTFGDSLFSGRDENGKQLRKVKRGFTCESEAQQALRDAILEMRRKPEIEPAMPTFAEFFNRWHAEWVERGNRHEKRRIVRGGMDGR